MIADAIKRLIIAVLKVRHFLYRIAGSSVKLMLDNIFITRPIGPVSLLDIASKSGTIVLRMTVAKGPKAKPAITIIESLKSKLKKPWNFGRRLEMLASTYAMAANKPHKTIYLVLDFIKASFLKIKSRLQNEAESKGRKNA